MGLIDQLLILLLACAFIVLLIIAIVEILMASHAWRKANSILSCQKSIKVCLESINTKASSLPSLENKVSLIETRLKRSDPAPGKVAGSEESLRSFDQRMRGLESDLDQIKSQMSVLLKARENSGAGSQEYSLTSLSRDGKSHDIIGKLILSGGDHVAIVLDNEEGYKESEFNKIKNNINRIIKRDDFYKIARDVQALAEKGNGKIPLFNYSTLTDTLQGIIERILRDVPA